jgi:CheY-like chemotaxis protein
MPGMSGSDVLRRIEAEPEWAKIPVALMSGFPRGRFAYAPPAVEYLEKPFNLERLNDVLTKLCAKAKTGTE